MDNGIWQDSRTFIFNQIVKKKVQFSLNISYKHHNRSYKRQIKPCLLTKKLPKAELNIAAAYRENKWGEKLTESK